MQSRTLTLASILAVALFGAAAADDTARGSDKPTAKEKKAAPGKPTTIQMKDARGRSLGTVVMTTSASGISFKLSLKNLPPGEHAITLHEVGICETPAFASVGDQVRDPTEAVGTIELIQLSGNITADDKGVARSTVMLTNASLHEVLRGDDGTAIVIHQGREVAMDGSDRIACGVIPAIPKQDK